MKVINRVAVKLKEDLVNYFKKGEIVEAEKIKLSKKDQYCKYPLEMPKHAYRLFHKETNKPLIVVWPQFVKEEKRGV